jgi:Protein of unknown function (DUF433)
MPNSELVFQQPLPPSQIADLRRAESMPNKTRRFARLWPTRLTAKAAREALRAQGYGEDQVPSLSTMTEVLNRMGIISSGGAQPSVAWMFPIRPPYAIVEAVSSKIATFSSVNSSMDSTVVKHIEATPNICGGKPRIAGTRIRVQESTSGTSCMVYLRMRLSMPIPI